MPQRTPEGKWVIWEVSTGYRLERWPVDAREIVASGDYTYDSPSGEREPGTQAVEIPAPVTTKTPEHSPGVPLVVTRSADAGAAAPIQLPTGRTPKPSFS